MTVESHDSQDLPKVSMCIIVLLKFKCILYMEIALNNISLTVCELETWTLNIVVMHIHLDGI